MSITCDDFSVIDRGQGLGSSLCYSLSDNIPKGEFRLRLVVRVSGVLYQGAVSAHQNQPLRNAIY